MAANLAQSLQQHCHLVGHPLLVARRQLMTDHPGLASWRRIDADRLAALALEARPHPATPASVSQVHRLAARYGADPGRLADALS